MENIFISYRREDSASISGRIFESLEQYFGQGTVFKDVDSIPIGVPFPQYLESVLAQCAVMLVIIGKRWLDTTDANGQRRLDAAGDFVRLELETAIRRNITIVPVYVEGAFPPSTEALPQSLRPIAAQNGMPVRNDPDYRNDMNRLIDIVQRYVIMSPKVFDPSSPGKVNASASAKFAPGAQSNRNLIFGGIALVVLFALVVAGVSGKFGHLFHGTDPGARNVLTHFCQAMHSKS